MISAVTEGFIILILFNGPILESELNIIRSTVNEWPAEVLLVDGEDKFEVDRTADDWGLSQHEDATRIEIKLEEVNPEDQDRYSEAILEKLKDLPVERFRVSFDAFASQPLGAPFPEMYVGAPLEKGGLMFTHEESYSWLDLERRANLLAARYKGEDASGTLSRRRAAAPRGGYPPYWQMYSGPPGSAGSAGSAPYESYRARVSAPQTPVPTPTEEEKAKIEKELTEVLNRMFDLKLIAYERRISRLEEELKSLREELEERRSNKDLIVTRRLNELTGKEDFLSW